METEEHNKSTDKVRLSPEQEKKRRRRSIAIALILIGFALLFYTITIVRLGGAE